jgi:hypothetical protein
MVSCRIAFASRLKWRLMDRRLVSSRGGLVPDAAVRVQPGVRPAPRELVGGDVEAANADAAAYVAAPQHRRHAFGGSVARAHGTSPSLRPMGICLLPRR